MENAERDFCFTLDLMRFYLTITDRGEISLPVKLREIVGFKSGDKLIAEATQEGLMLRPLSVEMYTHERVAEFEAGEAELEGTLQRKGC